MKPTTIPTIAATLLAMFIALAPTLAFAAGTTVTVSTDSPSYAGAATIRISGTVTPAPSATTAVFITVKNPAGSAVDFSTASVDTTSGAYTHALVGGGTAAWVTGTYTINASWSQSVAAKAVSAVTTFQYTQTAGGGPVTPIATGGLSNLLVQVQATTPAWPGQTIQISTLVEWSNNGSLASAHFQTVHFHTPQGTLVTLGTPTTIHKGFYFWTYQVPNNASDGSYFVHVWVNNSGVQGQGLGSFTVNSNIARQQSLTALSTAVQGLQSAVSAAQTSAANAATAVNGLTTTLNSVQSTVNTISGNVNNLVGGLATLQTVSKQVTDTSSAVANSQTYVLVVAALAAITLVLELAILVRKLS